MPSPAVPAIGTSLEILHGHEGSPVKVGPEGCPVYIAAQPSGPFPSMALRRMFWPTARRAALSRPVGQWVSIRDFAPMQIRGCVVDVGKQGATATEGAEAV
jgi:hypothetical protein